MPEVDPHSYVDIERNHDGEWTLTLSQIDGESPWRVLDPDTRGTHKQGPRAEEAYPITIPRNMPVRIENDGDYRIGYTIT
jgi:hypothetical protein